MEYAVVFGPGMWYKKINGYRVAGFELGGVEKHNDGIVLLRYERIARRLADRRCESRRMRSCLVFGEADNVSPSADEGFNMIF